MADSFNPIRIKGAGVAGTSAEGVVTVQGVVGGVVIPTADTNLDAATVPQGTTAPTQVVVVGGKTNDGTPQYRELPLGAGGRSVIVEGFATGTPIPVSFQSGTSKDSGSLTSASLAAGASVNLTAPDITTATTGYLMGFTAASSVPLKIEVQTFDGTTATTKRVYFSNSMESVYSTLPADDLITQVGGTGKAFRLKITNLDNINAADVYGSLSWKEN